MKAVPTEIPDVLILEPEVFGDERGFFMEVWNQRTFAGIGVPVTFVQDNHSKSVRGTLRGLHYQIRQPQGKLVRVVAGEVYDVAVDIRRSSTTFGRWVARTLSAANKLMMWVPPGFAHGFYVLSDEAEFTYKCTDFYAPQHERTIFWSDEDIGIDWPIPDGSEPLLSAKDAGGAAIGSADVFD
jgi:dTDP-4-dehydrorhamnose 3,5-epimerase